MYYKVTNDYGTAFIKTMKHSCVLVKIPFHGPYSIVAFESAFIKQADDIIVESSMTEFTDQAIDVFTKIMLTS